MGRKGAEHCYKLGYDACGQEPRWGDGTVCAMGTGCDRCRNSATWWHGKVGFACGREPCWGGGTRCLAGTSCNNCCRGNEWKWDIWSFLQINVNLFCCYFYKLLLFIYFHFVVVFCLFVCVIYFLYLKMHSKCNKNRKRSIYLFIFFVECAVMHNFVFLYSIDFFDELSLCMQ